MDFCMFNEFNSHIPTWQGTRSRGSEFLVVEVVLPRPGLLNWPTVAVCHWLQVFRREVECLWIAGVAGVAIAEIWK